MVSGSNIRLNEYLTKPKVENSNDLHLALSKHFLREKGFTKKNLSVNELKQEFKNIHCISFDTISCMITWDGVVTKYHKKYPKRRQTPLNMEKFIQSITIKTTVELFPLIDKEDLSLNLMAYRAEDASMSAFRGA
ncbi:hypothetical protein CWI38_0202p0050 [Hamiltosporidium tvaerminnensis]|uniref:Uncharacterized protein n=1 Tax=Hamiltosporidium tvaerminnensis TaxID=1176355 RepID=A0A4Q9LZS5_9MICR|nr:hypothetical protein CWI38_0202p0050 [Hamiltosporidium tvaerminnensis]